MKYTIKDARLATGNLMVALGKQWAGGHSDVGGWILDYNTIYGGCVIEEIVNVGGGVRRPLISNRLPPREFCEAIRFALCVLDIAKV